MAKLQADADADDDDDDHHGREGARTDSVDDDVARLQHHVSFLRECARASGLLGEVDDLSFKTNFALSSPPPPTGWEAGWTGGEPEEEEEGATKKGPSAVKYYELDVCHLTRLRSPAPLASPVYDDCFRRDGEESPSKRVPPRRRRGHRAAPSWEPS
jgi:hypothetical protein